MGHVCGKYELRDIFNLPPGTSGMCVCVCVCVCVGTFVYVQILEYTEMVYLCSQNVREIDKIHAHIDVVG